MAKDTAPRNLKDRIAIEGSRVVFFFLCPRVPELLGTRQKGMSEFSFFVPIVPSVRKQKVNQLGHL